MAATGRADSALHARREQRPRPRYKPHCAEIMPVMILGVSKAAYLVVVAAVGWLLFVASVWSIMATCVSFCVKVVASTVSYESTSQCSASSRGPATTVAPQPLSPSELETPAHGQSETPSQHCNVLEPGNVQPSQQAAATIEAVADLTSSDECAAAASDGLIDLVAASDPVRKEHDYLQWNRLEKKASATFSDYMMDWEQQQVVAASTTDLTPSETADAEVRQAASQGTSSCEAAETAGELVDAACVEARSSAADVAVVAHDSNTPSRVTENSSRQPAVDAVQNVQLKCKKQKQKLPQSKHRISLPQCNESPAAELEAQAPQATAVSLREEKGAAAKIEAADHINTKKKRKGANRLKQAPLGSPGAPGCFVAVPPAAEDAGLPNSYRDSGSDDTARTADDAGPPGSVNSAAELEALRAKWQALLEGAARCKDATQQPILLDRVSQMMQDCTKAGISVKYGRKVLQRLQAVRQAREALQSALASRPCTYEKLDAALTAAKGCTCLLEDTIVQPAEKLMATFISEQALKKQQQAQQQPKLQQPQQEQRLKCKKSQQPTAASITSDISAAAAVSCSDTSKQLVMSCSNSRRRASAKAVIPGQGLPRGCVGLINPNNKCYLNSVLQCINCCPDLVQPLLRAAQHIQSAAEAGLLTTTTGLQRIPAAADGVQWQPAAAVGPALVNLLTNIWSMYQHNPSKQIVISPHELQRTMTGYNDQWGDECQQDGQEFLLSLLAVLQSECNRVKVPPPYRELLRQGSEADQAAEAEACARSRCDSYIDDMCGGLIQSTITCSHCNNQRHCFDHSLGLTLPIPNSKKVSLQDCLSAFAEGEILTGDQKIRCRACQKTCDAKKQLRVFSYPKLLIVSLERFSSDGKGGNTARRGSWSGGKNHTSVMIDGNWPLDLTVCCSSTGLEAAAGKGCGAPRYELLALCEHHGGSLGGGHYTAQGRSTADGQWYHFNDGTVTASRSPSGSSRDVYLLFYRLLET